MTDRARIIVLDDEWHKTYGRRSEVYLPLLEPFGELSFGATFEERTLDAGPKVLDIESMAQIEPHLIVSDLDVLGSGRPQKGIELIDHIRSNPTLHTVPIIVVSEYIDHKDIVPQLEDRGVHRERRFYWIDLRDDIAQERERFRWAVRQAIANG